MTKIVTSIYNNLYGTMYGGRPSRETHYKFSLKTLMNMSDAEFIIYTNDYKDVSHFLKENIDTGTKWTLLEYNLDEVKYKNQIDKLKNPVEMVASMRCYELQYLKLQSLQDNITNLKEYIYWFDAGLSYSGLIPDKHLSNPKNGNYYQMYFDCGLYNNKFLHNLIKFTDDKMFVVGKDNDLFYWSPTIPDKYYVNKCQNLHVIGGFFGGTGEIVLDICNKFDDLLENLLIEEKDLYSEEQILSALYYNYKELFNIKTFDLWWHEDNIKGMYPDPEAVLSTYKSFYRVLEDINYIH